jgi:hypothetical protein
MLRATVLCWLPSRAGVLSLKTHVDLIFAHCLLCLRVCGFLWCVSVVSLPCVPVARGPHRSRHGAYVAPRAG